VIRVKWAEKIKQTHSWLNQLRSHGEGVKIPSWRQMRQYV